MLITTSGTSFTLSNVFLVCPVRPLRAGEKISTGGLALKTLKKLKGLRFGFPSLSTVLAKAIGRGATACKRYWCSTGIFRSLGSSESIDKYSGEFGAGS